MNSAPLDARTLSDAERMEIVSELLADVTAGIRTIQEVLRDHEDQTSVIYIAGAALGRLGWIPEQCCMLAGYGTGPVVGNANGWLLGDDSVLTNMQGMGEERQMNSPTEDAP